MFMEMYKLNVCAKCICKCISKLHMDMYMKMDMCMYIENVKGNA